MICPKLIPSLVINWNSSIRMTSGMVLWWELHCLGCPQPGTQREEPRSVLDRGAISVPLM